VQSLTRSVAERVILGDPATEAAEMSEDEAEGLAGYGSTGKTGTAEPRTPSRGDRGDDDERGQAQRTASADDWDNMRDGSISRRRAWRRPSPRWVLPFVVGATVSLGMTMAPRAEMYLDLACLAHPPVSTGSGAGLSAAAVAPFGRASYLASSSSVTASSNTTFTIPPDRVLTPGEKWFMDAQREMFGARPQLPKGPLSLPNGTEPGGGGDRGGEGGDQGGGEGEPRKSPSPPFPEIDPALCKTDKGVAAAAAKLTMCE
jgi:hypothetical protein